MKMNRLVCTMAASLLLGAETGFAASHKAAAKSESPITIGTIVYHLDDIDKSFKELHDAQFTSCQLNYNAGKMTPEFAEQVKEASRKYNIKVTTVVGVPGHSVWNFLQGPSTIGLVPAEGREAKIATYHKMIDFCQKAGVPAMHSHFGFIPEDPSSDQYKTFIFVMRQLAGYAKERGIMIYFETGQETPTTLIRALKDIGTGNVFINCDVANLLLYGKANPTDAIRQFGPLVKDIHAKDGTYPSRDNPDQLGAEKPIPEGDVDFPAIIKLLKEQGYTGALTIENELSDRNKEYLTKTRKYLQDLVDKK